MVTVVLGIALRSAGVIVKVCATSPATTSASLAAAAGAWAWTETAENQPAVEAMTRAAATRLRRTARVERMALILYHQRRLNLTYGAVRLAWNRLCVVRVRTVRVRNDVGSGDTVPEPRVRARCGVHRR